MSSLKTFIDENATLIRQEELILEATELLSREMNLQQISKADLARKLGKSKAFVTQCLNGRQNLTLRTLADFFGALDLKMLIGAEPVHGNLRVSQRLYPIGAWALEQRCFDPAATLGVAASASPCIESDLYEAAAA